jgi:hypothetical protein
MHSSLLRTDGALAAPCVTRRTSGLVALPPSICDLPALETLEVANNPLQRPPMNIAQRGLVAIRTFFPTVIDDDRETAGEEPRLTHNAQIPMHTLAPFTHLLSRTALRCAWCRRRGVELLQDGRRRERVLALLDGSFLLGNRRGRPTWAVPP